jgi:hypothetical protein
VLRVDDDGLEEEDGGGMIRIDDDGLEEEDDSEVDDDRLEEEDEVRDEAAACSEAGVKAAACSEDRDEAAACSGAGIEDGTTVPRTTKE